MATGPLLTLVSLYALVWTSHGQQLHPNGTNVCSSARDPPSLSCCPGWRQQGNECSIAICDGPHSCSPQEICIRPGVCRCPHGFFGAKCVTRCPDQFWGPDCRNECPCHPNGRCEARTGRCLCYRGYWGPRCSRKCDCLHGQCDSSTGSCQCEAGWWGHDCSRLCRCETGKSVCDPQTGRCLCSPGYWGTRCNLLCYCHRSPCGQLTGVCECTAGWWGPLCERRCACLHGFCNSTNGHCVCQPGYHGTTCNQPCQTGLYGENCRKRCGHCKDAEQCSPSDGSCPACLQGWTGSQCERPCPPGAHGENCTEHCPHCRHGEPCNAITGHCRSCNPGWIGPRCDTRCVSGTFGLGCQSICPDCNHGNCHHIAGECVCHEGYTGARCNLTCLSGFYGLNCSTSCHCLGAACDPVTGDCPFSQGGVVIAVVVVSLLILLCILCCCCCGNDKNDPKDRTLEEEHGPITRMKHHVRGVLLNLGSGILCFSFGNQKLPKVTVSHHDADVSFNCSFIDSPSAGWESVSFSSFGTDEGEPVYCVPPQEGSLLLTPEAGFQELSSRCNYFPVEQSEPNSEDTVQPLNIPRTSSIVKAHRPSVSFAEGTKFGPEWRRGSMPESRVIPAANAQRKRKLSWTLSKLSPIESVPGQSECQPYQCIDVPGVYPDGRAPSHHSLTSPGARAGEHTAPSPMAPRDPQGLEPRGSPVTPAGTRIGGSSQKAPTREPQRSSRIWASTADGIGVGTVQAMLRRFGSFQKQRSAPQEELGPRARGQNVSKLQRTLEKKLRSCASAGEAASPSVHCSPGSQQSPAGSTSTLPRKALIPTTPILHKLVANVTEGTQGRLDMLHPSSQSEPSPGLEPEIPGGQQEPRQNAL
ncbi:scavenger receptor class F member 1 isoform X2 [Hemiscyllium ocellatum]|uniref:scavenger receptor class F member 1 isoform X2 n=1 Tax=Hemiscyllium ocellatum TaxID=170820 RepID=UPI0029666967|nr:scavenger receptor class F member 1 isoform X2 [Hemiscyllium ocellatum]